MESMAKRLKLLHRFKRLICRGRTIGDWVFLDFIEQGEDQHRGSHADAVGVCELVGFSSAPIIRPTPDSGDFFEQWENLSSATFRWGEY